MTLATDPQHALAAYGTLAPGESNHNAVGWVRGSWVAGTVLGYTFQIGWGPAEGYPGFIADPEGHRVPVQVLISEQLPDHWDRLDDFEGPGYERTVVDVALADGGTIAANIYVTLTDTD